MSQWYRSRSSICLTVKLRCRQEGSSTLSFGQGNIFNELDKKLPGRSSQGRIIKQVLDIEHLCCLIKSTCYLRSCTTDHNLTFLFTVNSNPVSRTPKDRKRPFDSTSKRYAYLNLVSVVQIISLHYEVLSCRPLTRTRLYLLLWSRRSAYEN